MDGLVQFYTISLVCGVYTMAENKESDISFSSLVNAANSWATKSTISRPHHLTSPVPCDELRKRKLENILVKMSEEITTALKQRLLLKQEEDQKTEQDQVDQEDGEAEISFMSGISGEHRKKFHRSSNELRNMTAFRGENRMNRMMPPPRPQETPLENRTSRLRKQAIEQRSSLGTDKKNGKTSDTLPTCSKP